MGQGTIQENSERGQAGRPRSVTWLAVGVLIFTMLYLIRLVDSIRQWSFLSGVLDVSPLYLAVTGLVWSVTGAILFWGLWTGRRWVPDAFRGATLFYLVYYWLDRLLLAQSPAHRANWPFAAGMSILIPVIIAWILSRRKARAFFGDEHG